RRFLFLSFSASRRRGRGRSRTKMQRKRRRAAASEVSGGVSSERQSEPRAHRGAFQRNRGVRVRLEFPRTPRVRRGRFQTRKFQSAERGGFEPPIRLHVYILSKDARSTTLP